MLFWDCKYSLLAGIALTGAYGCNQADPRAAVIEAPKATDKVDLATSKTEPVSRLEMPFASATITDDIPDGQEQPPDVTITGKPTGPLRLAVEKIWSSIKLTGADGKALTPTVKLTTSAGDIEIALNAELAPNHVRNFLVLCRAHYFDGLQFDRIIHQVSDEEPKVRLDLVKFGCPLGTGERGTGHIGYFLRPETSETVKHDEGTVGFWHDEDPNTAGCRLYITLGPAPALDGGFTIIGKVVRGLDVVKNIAAQPVLNPAIYPEKEIPKSPTKITSATATSDK